MSAEQIFLINLFWRGFLGAGLASTGFGVLFNVRGKNLFLAGLTGAVGGTIYMLFGKLGWPEGMANFIAAAAIAILGEIFARKQKTTVTTFTACALIPLVPGGTAYEMMVDFATGRLMDGAERLIAMLSISGMLALGILVVSTLTRFFLYSHRKVKKTTKKLIEAEQSFVQSRTSKKGDSSSRRRRKHRHRFHKKPYSDDSSPSVQIPRNLIREENESRKALLKNRTDTDLEVTGQNGISKQPASGKNPDSAPVSES